jgi:hypothetical protein
LELTTPKELAIHVGRIHSTPKMQEKEPWQNNIEYHLIIVHNSTGIDTNKLSNKKDTCLTSEKKNLIVKADFTVPNHYWFVVKIVV